MNNKKGFTLIEIMIVLAIIGILAAIAIPNFQSYKKKQKAKEAVEAGEVVKTNTPKKAIVGKTKLTGVTIKCINGFYVVIQGGNIFYLGQKDSWDDIEAIQCE